MILYVHQSAGYNYASDFGVSETLMWNERAQGLARFTRG